MLKAAENIEPERREPYLRGALVAAVVVPAAFPGLLILAVLFLDKGDTDTPASDIQIYGP